MRKFHIKKTVIALMVTTSITTGGLGFQSHKLNETEKENDKLKHQADKNIELLSKNNNLLIKLNANLKIKDNDINNFQETINVKNSQINTLRNQLEKAKKRNESPRSKQQTVSRGTEKEQKVLYVIATAYTADCKGCSGITKTGKDVRNTIYEGNARVVAVDPTVIPLYSKLKVETKNETFYAVALDTGGVIKNNRLDVLVESYDEAIQFGSQRTKVTILN